MKYQLLDRTVSGVVPDASLVEAAGGSELLAKLLLSRGVSSAEDAHRFLHPDASQLNDPFTFRDMQRSVDLIKGAAASGRKVYVHGDYDADGTCAAAILKLALADLSIDASVIIPRRTDDGYGLSLRRIEEMDPKGLLITVDCGISNVEEIDFALQRGMDVIVTDHHICPEVLPDATCILNPNVPGESYPDRNLCGAGVALKLAEAVAGRQAAIQYIDLAAFATIADVVPLVGENRVITALGLAKMNTEPSIGIEALMSNRARPDDPLFSADVAFDLAPAVNAAGRISSAQIAFDLLSSRSPVIAGALSRTLGELNRQRQEKQTAVFEEACSMLEGKSVPDFIVLRGDSWDSGVLGPAASKIAEAMHRPTILCARAGDAFVGSGRSAGGVNLHDALSSAGHLMVKFGGHAQAAGLTVLEENLPALAQALADYMVPRRSLISQVPVAEFDYEPALPADPEIIASLCRLEPFGAGNPIPSALIRNARIEQIRPIGAGQKHSSFEVRTQDGGAIRAVMFGTSAGDIPPYADVVGELRLSTYPVQRGRPEMIVRTLSFETREQHYFRRAVEVLHTEKGPRDPDLFFRDKKRMGLIYSAFRAAAPDEEPVTILELYARSRQKIRDLTREETAFAYSVFRELGLIVDQPDARIQILINTKKCDLSDSRIYRACGR